MRDARKLMLVMLVFVAAAAFAACGSSDGSTSSSSDEAEVSGEFAPVADAPAPYSEVAGEAELERSGGGTTVSLEATGLQPKTAYVAHLHTGGCDQADPGGPHFQFEKGGSEEPPNEIHLEFTSNADGEGEAEATSKREVPPGEAGSVVIHLGDSHHQTTANEPGDVETVFVHEGVDHSGSPARNSKARPRAPKAKRRRAGTCRRSSSATANRSAASRSSNTAPVKRSASGSPPTRRKRSTSTATTS